MTEWLKTSPGDERGKEVHCTEITRGRGVPQAEGGAWARGAPQG